MMETPTKGSPAGRKSYSLAYKRSALLRLEECNNVSKIAREFNVSPAHIRGWRKQQVGIMEVTGPLKSIAKRKRRRSGGGDSLSILARG